MLKIKGLKLPMLADEIVTGKVFFVDSGGTNTLDDPNYGGDPEKTFATWDYAIGKCKDSRGDHIVLMEGHAETVASAGAISVDVIGVTTIGVGTGALRPTFTFSETGSTITVSAASNVIKNILIKPSINLVVSPIVVSAPDCTIDIEIQDLNYEVECISGILTTADADRIDIKLKYRGFIAGDACATPIKLLGVDTGRIYVDFYGLATTSVVEFATGANCHDIIVEGFFYNESAALTKNVVDAASSTWSVVGYDSKGDANFSGGDAKTVAYADVETIASDLVIVDTVVDTVSTACTKILSDILLIQSDVGAGASGALSDLETVKSDLLLVDGVVDTVATACIKILSDILLIQSDVGNGADGLLSDLETLKSDVVLVDAVVDGLASYQERVTVETGIVLTGGTVSDIFTVNNGPVLVTNLSLLITTVVSSSACKLAFVSQPSGGSDIDISDSGASTSSGLDIQGFAEGDIVYAVMDGTIAVRAATGTALPTWPGTARMMVPAGGIKIELSTTGPSSGTGTAYITYIPMTSTSTVTSLT